MVKWRAKVLTLNAPIRGSLPFATHMPPEQNVHPAADAPASESLGNVPNGSAAFRTVPNFSEGFRTVPNRSETFRTVPRESERKEYCTATVREVARMFEAAGVARTERSIINWCQPNKLGVARLDNYFDPNERKYFISPQSVELAIQEEKAKAAKGAETSTPADAIPHVSEAPQKQPDKTPDADADTIRVSEKEVMDLKITNRAKDYFIEQLQKEREGFTREREKYVEQLIASNRKLGELETRLLQLEAPDPKRPGTLTEGGDRE